MGTYNPLVRLAVKTEAMKGVRGIETVGNIGKEGVGATTGASRERIMFPTHEWGEENSQR